MRPGHAARTAAALLLLIIDSLSGGSALSSQTPTGDKDLVPALLAIRALRASLGMDVPVDRILMGTQGQVLDDRQAAEVLMDSSPSRCSATYQDDAVAIDCRVLGPHEYEQELRYFKLTNGWLGELGRETLAESGRHLTMVTGGGPAILVNTAAIDSAARMFDIDMDGFTVGGRYPTDDECSSGVGWVLQFSGRRGR